VQYGEGPLYVMGPAHLAELVARSGEPMIEVLRQIPFVALVGDDPIAVNVDQLLAQANLPESAVRVQTSQLAEELVARGLGWALIDYFSARQVDRSRLCVLPLQPAIACPLNAFFVRNQPAGLPVRSFLEKLSAVLKAREPW
jgi:DNA-binding transcriptional LysR family regulator